MARLPAALPLAVLLVAALAGCADDAPAVTADLVTPGAWDVRGDTDRVLAWVHNDGRSATTVVWSVTGVGGTALPEGWSVDVTPATAPLAAGGSLQAGGGAGSDWGFALLTLTLPPGQAAATVPLELHAGPARRDITVTVHDDREATSGPGSRVDVHYEGRFADSREAFDAGDFPTTLGRGETVPGFDYGLMGLAPGETAVLVLPPPLGYGYDPPASHARFAGKTLEFTVTLTSLEG